MKRPFKLVSILKLINFIFSKTFNHIFIFLNIKYFKATKYFNIIFSYHQRDPLGKRSGVNFWAAPIFPLIFICPFINAVCGFNFPSKRSTASLSTKANVASAFPSFPFVMDPFPVLRSIVHVVAGFPLAGAIYIW